MTIRKLDKAIDYEYKKGSETKSEGAPKIASKIDALKSGIMSDIA